MDLGAENYASAFGACFIAFCVSFILYGVTTTQAFGYARTCSGDSKWIRFTVLFLWLAETAHTAISIQYVYQDLITGYGQPEVLLAVYWNAGAFMVITYIIILTVHSFFIFRIWILSNRSVFAITLPSLLTLAYFGFDIASAITIFQSDSWLQVHSERSTVIEVYFLLCILVANDTVITGTLIYYLRRGRTGYIRTYLLVKKLEMYVVNSGALTVAASLAVLLCFLINPGNMVYIGLTQTICKLYNNALLATLNARSRMLPPRFDAPSSTSMDTHELQFHSSDSRCFEITGSVGKGGHTLDVILDP